MHTSISKKLLAGLLSVVMVLSLFAAIPANNAQAASLSLSGNTKVSAGVTNTYKILNMAKTQYAKVTVSNKAVTVKKGTATVKSTTKIAGTGKAIALKANAKAAVAGKSYTLTVKVYNKKTNKVVKTLKKVVKVYNKTEAVALDQSTVTVDAGKTATLVATTTPAENTRPVTWTSSNEAVATVVDGVVTGVAEGTATITAKSGSVTASATVTVEEDRVPEIVSATAPNSKTVVVTFNTKLGDVTLGNFDLNTTDTTITSVKVDGKTVTLTLAQALVSTKEYKLTAIDMVSAGGKKAASDLTASVIWSYSDGVQLEMTKDMQYIGTTSGFKLTDASGTRVTIVKDFVVYSSNTNVVSVAGAYDLNTAIILTAEKAGSAEVTAKATLVDGSVVTQSFAITIVDASASTKTEGIHLETSLADPYFKNTADYTRRASYAKDYIYVNDPSKYYVEMFDTVSGNPSDAHVDFATLADSVQSLNPAVADSALDGTGIKVWAKSVGTASFRVTMKDGTRRTFSIKVLAKPYLAKVELDETNLVLSDECQTANTDGVSTQRISARYLDQYGYPYYLTLDDVANGLGKIVVGTTNASSKLNIISDAGAAVGYGKYSAVSATGAALSSGDVVTDTMICTPAAGECFMAFQIGAQKDQTLSGAVVTVKGYKKSTDTTPVYNNSVSVVVKNINLTDVKQSLDIVGPAFTLDAANNNRGYFGGAYRYDATYDMSVLTDVYYLNKAGYRIGNANADYALVASSIKDNTGDNKGFLTITGAKKIGFTADAIYLMNTANTETYYCDVTASGVTKTIAFTYCNTGATPDKATVTANTVEIHTNGAAGLDVKDIIWGVTAATNGEMLVDNLYGVAGDGYYAINAYATFGGYLYNAPLVTVKNAYGKDIALGTQKYGLATSLAGIGNEPGSIFRLDAAGVAATSGLGANGKLVAGYSITNVVCSTGVTSIFTKTDNATTAMINALPTLTSGQSITFTLVISKVYVEGDATAENLLASPVAVTVSVTY